MTIAWYGHLKYGHDWPLWKARFQLKIIQEVGTLRVFTGFAIVFPKEKLAWNYLVAFVFIALAAFFAFAFKAPGPAA
jgi:uncharacterized protein (DUF486 family)